MKQSVFAVRVNSRNFVSDFGAELKNIIGGRLKTYEVMIDDAIKECMQELINKYNYVDDIKIVISEFSNKSIAIIVYGVIDNVK